MEGSSKGRYRVKSKERGKSFKLLNPNIKIEILIYYPYTFSMEVAGRICLKYQLDSSSLIMYSILMTTLFYKALILQGEI